MIEFWFMTAKVRAGLANLALLAGLLLGQKAQAFYNPSTGRWLSRDPVGERGGHHLYALLGNSPCNKTDYLGFDVGTVTVVENHSAGLYKIGG